MADFRPAPAAIAAAADLALPVAEAGAARQIARRLASGELRLDEGVDRVAVRHRLLAVPGIGPDQVEDVMLHALGNRWRPWRGYGIHLLWRARSDTLV